MTDVNSRYIRLTGKAEVPKEISIGSNYYLGIDGSIVSKTVSDNENGTVDEMYLFKPVLIEVLTPKGETLKLKDTRKESQKLRSRLYVVWGENNSNLPFDVWYAKVMMQIRLNIEEVLEQVMPVEK